MKYKTTVMVAFVRFNYTCYIICINTLKVTNCMFKKVVKVIYKIINNI